MRWVTYLSPSGGARRAGVIDDGCVHGCPESHELDEILAAPAEAVRALHERTLTDPVEIIVEFEARLCAPVRLAAPLPLHVQDTSPELLEPRLVVGTDDGVAAPGTTERLEVQAGVLSLPWGQGAGVGYAPACLWRGGDGQSTALTLGPAVVLPDHPLDPGAELVVTVDDVAAVRVPLAQLIADAAMAPQVWLRGTATVRTGCELHLDASDLGEFEVRLSG